MTALTDQPLVRDLLRPENLPDAGTGNVDFVSTHGSLVFLTADSVYKVKRAKDYGFFDYSTLAARKHFCELEVTLNRRTAPDVYLGVLPVRRDGRGHSLTRGGEVVDYAVHMRRLPDARSARALLEAGLLQPADVEATAAFVAGFHRRVPELPPDAAPLRASFEENFTQVQPFVGRMVDADAWQRIHAAQRHWLRTHADLLASRPRRDGHGDLRLEHVYLLEQGPVLIDCIEFLDRFRVADPALDAAFLAMDLRFRERPDLAEVFVASFAYESDDYDAYALIDGYMSYRAVVRAKVACFVAADDATSAATAARKTEEARRYFHLAAILLAERRPAPRLWAVGGMIAAGKTTLARALARATGAPVVSADSTRKGFAGLPRDQPGPKSLYTPEFGARVQAEVARRAQVVLRSGRDVIVDTTLRSRELRGAVRELAHSCGARFAMLECHAPEAVLRQRLRARTGGVSDAREDLLETFLRTYEPADELAASELQRIDSSRPLADALDVLAERGWLRR